MATNAVIVDGLTGGTNTIVVKVITQTTINSDSTINVAANKGYILTSATLQTINMPTPCIVGDVFALHGKGVGLFKVAQRAGEQILFGNTPTTVGITGFIESTHANDSVYLICVDAAGIWTPDNGTFGNFSIDGTTTNNAINNTGGGMPTLIDTQTFTADGTWNKPDNAKFVNILIIAGGGGAGSGAREASSSHTGGVGGAYGGVTAINNYPIELLDALVDVTVGLGGIGGVGQTVNNTSGNNGLPGDDSIFDVFAAEGGDGGDGGGLSTRQDFTGLVSSSTVISYHAEQIASVDAGTQPPPIEANNSQNSVPQPSNVSGQFCPSSGGPGRSTSSTLLGFKYPGNAIAFDYSSAADIQAAVAPVASPGNNGSTYETYFGGGASGGDGTVNAAGFDGGDGGDNGGGGGGGGCSDNNFVSGKGGNGGPGVVVIFTYG